MLTTITSSSTRLTQRSVVGVKEQFGGQLGQQLVSLAQPQQQQVTVGVGGGDGGPGAPLGVEYRAVALTLDVVVEVRYNLHTQYGITPFLNES